MSRRNVITKRSGTNTNSNFPFTRDRDIRDIGDNVDLLWENTNSLNQKKGRENEDLDDDESSSHNGNGSSWFRLPLYCCSSSSWFAFFLFIFFLFLSYFIYRTWITMTGFQVAIFETTQGNIHLVLFPTVAPRTVNTFKKLVRTGFFDQGSFYRIEPDFVVQGGGVLMNGTGRASPFGAIPLEYKLPNVKYMVSMARFESPHSATSDFSIMLNDRNSQWLCPGGADGYGYAVFAEVRRGVNGWDAVERIVQRGDSGGGGGDGGSGGGTEEEEEGGAKKGQRRVLIQRAYMDVVRGVEGMYAEKIFSFFSSEKVEKKARLSKMVIKKKFDMEEGRRRRRVAGGGRRYEEEEDDDDGRDDARDLAKLTDSFEQLQREEQMFLESLEVE